MSNKADMVDISYDQNPAVAEALRDAKPGDKGTMEFKYVVERSDQMGCTLKVDAFIPEGYEVAKDNDSTDVFNSITSTNGDAMTPTAMLVRKTQDKGSKKESPVQAPLQSGY